MEKFAVTRSISDAQKELEKLVVNAPLPPDLLKFKIERFVVVLTSTQDEYDAARLRLRGILDMSYCEFPTGHPTTCEMEGFGEDLKKQFGSEVENRFGKIYNGFPGGGGGDKGADTMESNTAGWDLLELLEENEELLEVFNRCWLVGKWEIRFIPSGSYDDGL